MKVKTLLSTFMASAALAGFASSATGQIFTEDFDTIINGTTLTTSNTNLTYIRKGSSAPDIAAINPSSFGSGSSGSIQGITTSLTGIGVRDSLPTSDVYTLSVDFRIDDVSAGDIVFGVGSGSSFTGNSTFSTAQGLFFLQSDSGNFERRTSSSWSNTGLTLQDNTLYSLHVVANGSSSSITYGDSSVAAGKMDIYMNDELLVNDQNVTNSLSADGFRIYSVSGASAEIDNIALYDSAVAVPEPSIYALLAGILSIISVMVHRRG